MVVAVGGAVERGRARGRLRVDRQHRRVAPPRTRRAPGIEAVVLTPAGRDRRPEARAGARRRCAR